MRPLDSHPREPSDASGPHQTADAAPETHLAAAAAGAEEEGRIRLAVSNLREWLREAPGLPVTQLLRIAKAHGLADDQAREALRRARAETRPEGHAPGGPSEPGNPTPRRSP